MILGFLSWLLGSKTGRVIALCFLALAASALAWRRAFHSGAASEKSRQAKASLDALRNRISIDDEIYKIPPDIRRRELARWMQQSSGNR